MLLRLKGGPTSSRRLKEISTSSRLHPGDTVPSTGVAATTGASGTAINRKSDVAIQSARMVGPFSSH